MKKITNQTRFKIRWLNTNTLMLLLFDYLFSFFKRNQRSRNANTNSLSILRYVFVICITIGGVVNGISQTTINTMGPPGNFVNNNGTGLTTFNFTNTNAFPVIIQEVSTIVTGSHTNAEAYLYTSLTPVTGSPGVISTASTMPWVQAANQTITLVGNTVPQVVLSGLNVMIPANTTVGMAIGVFTANNSGGVMQYYTMPASTFTYSAGGVDMVFSPTSAYGGTSYTSAATNNPRAFIGSISFIPGVPCTGQVSAGTASTTATNACIGVPFTLSLGGTVTFAGGVTYQWQSSPSGANNFTNIGGATGVSYTVASQTVATDYRCFVTCTHTNSTDTSNIVSVNQNSPSQCYCTPTYTYSCSNTSENINSFILIGEGTSAISDLNTGCSTGNYQNRIPSFVPVDLLQDGEYVVQVNTNYSSGSSVWANLWIDFNDNGIFETSEQLIKDLPMATSPAFVSPKILIPASANPGIHRMRVRANYNATVDACSNGNWGETHDYEVNIIPISCYRPLITSVIKASATSVNVTITPSALNTGTVSYQYEVRTSGLPGSGATGLVTSGPATTTNFTVGGLQAGAVYTIYIRTSCSATDFSQYSSFEFGIPATLPYTQNFEGTQPGWVLANGGSVNEWVVGNAVASAGTKSLYITNDQGVSNAYNTSTSTVVHAYKDFELVAGVTDISISFDWRALAESCCDYIRVWLVPTTFKPTPGTQIAAGTGRVNLFNNLNLDASFKRAQTIRSTAAYTGSFRLVFEWRNDTSAGTMPGAAIDNIEIKRVTCYEPLTMTLSNVTEKGVTVTVAPDPKNTGTVSYQYEVRTSGAAGSGTVGRVATGTSTTPVFNITGLPANTDLQIYVRTACSSSDFSFWKSGTFKTLEVLVIDVVQVDIDCFGVDNGSVSVTTTSGGKTPYTYAWTPSGATATSISNLAPGTYSLTVSDGSGQVINRSFTITQPTLIVPNLNFVNVSCNGKNDGSATVAPSGGIAPYTVLWSDGVIGLSRTNLTPGAYSVTVRDANSCPIVQNFTIVEPSVITTSVSTQSNVTVYGGNDGSATVLATGGTGAFTYLWSPYGGTTDTASNLGAGTYSVLVTDANGCTTTQSVVITQPAIPYDILLVSQKNISCNGTNDGSITVNVTGGTPPYSYVWSNGGGNTASISNLAAGTYTLTVTDSDSSVITKSYVITEPSVLNVTSSLTNVTCNGLSNGTATASVTGGTAPYTYFWSNGMTTANANNLTAGTYSVTVTDANNCKATASVTIVQPSVLSITPTVTNISCSGQVDGSVSLTVNGGAAPFSYVWSSGQTTGNINGLSAGVYSVTVTDANNCTVTQTVTITSPAFVHAPVAANQSFCTGQNATLANVVATGSNIKWYSAATGGVLLPSTTILVNGTTYYATQTVGTCESSTRTAVQITLGQGTPLTTTQLNVCNNTRVQNMTVDGFNYTQLKWYTSATSTTELVSSQLLATGVYYVSSYVGTCESARQAITVTVAAIVPAPTASSQTICNNSILDDLVVGKDPSSTLRWYSSPQIMTPLAGTTVVSTGTYYVQQVIGNCESVRIPVSVQVVNVSAPAMTSIATCQGNTVSDLHPSVGKYVWYTTNSTTTPLAETFVITAGTYYIAFENSGCTSTRTQVIVTVSARPTSPTGQTNQMFGFAARVSNLVMNQPNVIWFASYNDAVRQQNPLSPNHLLQNGSTYYGILTGTNSCGSLPTAVTVALNLSNGELDLAQLKYFPNPVASELNITYIEEVTKVEVFTITGQKVLSNNYQSNEVKVDLNRLSSGTYLVRIDTEKASQFVKVIKK